jgi:hypothetical protein
MGATLSPVPVQQFFDDNGTPLAGGKLYSFAAGTDTPIDTYTDYTGNTAHTNPIVLDSAGRAEVWLGPVAYKLSLTDSVDAPVWTVDHINDHGGGGGGGAAFETYNLIRVIPESSAPGYVAITGLGVYAAGDGGAGTWWWDAASVLSDDNGCILTPLDSSGAGRWIRQTNAQPLSVRWYGATGDGVTDDGNSFALANTAAQSGTIVPASLGIYVPAGQYYIASGLTLAAPMILDPRALIMLTGSTQLTLNPIIDPNDYSRHFDCQGTSKIILNANEAYPAVQWAYPQWWHGATEDWHGPIQAAVEASRWVKLRAGTYDCSDQISVQYPSQVIEGDGINTVLDMTSSGAFSGFIFGENPAGSPVAVSDCVIRDLSIVGTTANLVAISMANADRITVDGVTIVSSAAGIGAEQLGGANVIVRDCHITGCTQGIYDPSRLMPGIRVTGTKIESCLGYGLVVSTDGASIADCVIRNNQVTDNLATQIAIAAATATYGGSYITISDSQIYTHAVCQASTPLIALTAGGTSTTPQVILSNLRLSASNTATPNVFENTSAGPTVAWNILGTGLSMVGTTWSRFVKESGGPSNINISGYWNPAITFYDDSIGGSGTGRMVFTNLADTAYGTHYRNTDMATSSNNDEFRGLTHLYDSDARVQIQARGLGSGGGEARVRLKISGSLTDVLTVKSTGILVDPTVTTTNVLCTGTLKAGTSGASSNLDVSSGNPVYVRDGLTVKTGKVSYPSETSSAGAATCGIVNLTAGEAQVTTTAVTATSVILLTCRNKGGISNGTSSTYRVFSLTPGSGFWIGASNLSETSSVSWMIVEQSA